MVMLILVVVSILGVGSAQIALMSERSARNDRDMQVAWQSAEAALMDAQLDMLGTRASTFDGSNDSYATSGCGTSGNALGFCTQNLTGKPAWLTVDFTNTGASAKTIEFGHFTSRPFVATGTGIQPAKAPRYIIELIQDNCPTCDTPPQKFIYRVTAMGFGPRPDIQAVLQALYRPHPT